jgi:hypothetical protein
VKKIIYTYDSFINKRVVERINPIENKGERIKLEKINEFVIKFSRQ